ncbi:PAS domain S-box protein [Geomonas paludis]|uniref:histidine kinase n=1 Tax=Geomonas paludis TaxID=2740185 RepID=A0ABY4LIL0_9BACT|nr:PAS domain S-box protein [Geomonas paludis]UPU37833.1 PAS domain S-box protein [Geomonas paludis]
MNAEQIKEFCHAVNDACCSVDMAGNILATNDSFCALVGYSRAELLIKRARDLTPSVWHIYEDAIVNDQVKVRGFSDIYEKEYRRKDGHLVPVELTRTLIRDDNGSPVGMFAMVRDLTARKRIEQQLLVTQEEYRTLAEEYRALAENSPDIVLRFDRGLRHTYANSAAGRACGIPIKELVGTTLFQIGLPPAVTDVWKERIESVFRTGIPVKVEDVMAFSEGQRDFEYQLVPEGGDSTSPVSVLVVGREITERNRAAAELDAARQELETRVAKRTQSLQEALQEQESFSYTVSHDLRAPLRHINAYLAILHEDYGDALPPEAQSLIGKTRLASCHMGNLIDDLLDLARVGRIALTKVDVDLSALASSSCETLRGAEPSRQLRFLVQDGMRARGDRLLLQQMLDNLLDNAWKYSAGIPEARIECGTEVCGDEVIFFVRDNGVGFEMAYSDQLFHPFQRLHGPEYQGNGIGLATVKRIIDRHGGRVWAESKKDEGAAFYFTLP